MSLASLMFVCLMQQAGQVRTPEQAFRELEHLTDARGRQAEEKAARHAEEQKTIDLKKEELKKRFQQMVDDLNEATEAVQAFAKSYNLTHGDVWPLHESKNLEKRMKALDRSWNTVSKSEPWLGK